MIPIITHINGIDLNKFMIDIRRRMPDTNEKILTDYLKFVKNSAKRRAPRNTGELRDSIESDKTNKSTGKITVGVPYGAAQEKGYKPHVIPFDYMTQRGRGETLNPSGFVTVRKFTPYIAPALQAGSKRFPEIASRHVQKMISDARRHRYRRV